MRFWTKNDPFRDPSRFDKLRLTFDKLRLTFDRLRLAIVSGGNELNPRLTPGLAHTSPLTHAGASLTIRP
jgi:hypothetical protein